MRISLFLLFLSVALAPTTSAQGGPGPLAWELLGEPPTTNTCYPPGGLTDSCLGKTDQIIAAADSLYAITGDGLFVRAYGDAAPWRRALDFQGVRLGVEVGHVDADSARLYFGNGGPVGLNVRLRRLPPWGERWTSGDVVLDPATALPTLTASGRLVAGTWLDTDGVAFSDDGGEVWSTVPGPVPTIALGSTPPGGDMPPVWPPRGVPEAPGALVACGAFSGLHYSFDDGLTWAPSNLGSGDYHMNVQGFAHIQAGSRSGGHAGRLLAAVGTQLDWEVRVYGSDDGGRTWTALLDPDAPISVRQGRVLTAPDGGAYFWSDRGRDATRHLYGSSDGGETWADLGLIGPSDPEWSFQVNDLVLGPDGRLYAGGRMGAGPFPNEGEPRGGLWRTVQPVTVATEPSPPETPEGFGLRTSPNPASGAITISLVGADSNESIRVVVYDALGREVAVLHDGPVGAEARFSVERGALSPGVYLARAETGGAVATALFTIAR